MMKRLEKGLILSVLILITYALNTKAQEVQFIAVHLGNAENMKALDESAFPNFKFYYNDSEFTSYSEEQRMIGNSKNLVGWYGEVPEKMGFAANYRGSYGKGYGFPYLNGALYIIDQECTVNYQLQAERFNEDNYTDLYDRIQNEIITAVKRLKRGKLTKKSKKQRYLKNAPIGELEASKGAKIDKKNDGIVGWDLPDIMVKNENDESISLKDLTSGKISVVVFYTLNGAHYLKANSKGVIENEWDGDKLIAPTTYVQQVEEKAVSGDYENKSEAKKGFAKTMFKAGVAAGDNKIAQLIVNNKEELNEAQRVKAYIEATQNMIMVEEISRKLKK